MEQRKMHNNTKCLLTVKVIKIKVIKTNLDEVEVDLQSSRVARVCIDVRRLNTVI